MININNNYFFCSQIICKYNCDHDIRALIEIGDFIGYVYMQNSMPALKYYYLMLCNKYANISERVIRATIAVYIFTAVLFILLRLGESFIKGKMIPAMEVHFPGIDEETYGGFAFVLLYNYCGTVAGFAISGTYNLLLFLIFANMPMVSAVIVGHLNDLKDVLLDPDRESRDVSSRLYNIILMHNKYIEYIIITSGLDLPK